MRSSVVLPEPGRPEQRHQLALPASPDRRSPAPGSCRKSLLTLRTLDAHGHVPFCSPRVRRTLRFPFDRLLTTKVTSANSANSEATANARTKLIIVVEDFDMQRHRVREPANVAGNHRHGAELAHRARVAQDHAVEQRPFHVGQRDAQERLPAARAQRERRFFFVVALRLHQSEAARAPRTET